MALTGKPNATLEEMTVGPVLVVDSDVARQNKATHEAHFAAEWSFDIEGTMRTMHRDQPWQRIHGLGLDVQGFEEVRDYYLGRFESWPDPVMDEYDRVTVTESTIVVEGTLNLRLTGDFRGQEGGSTVGGPAVVVIDFRDGLILGETVYVTAARR